MLRSVSAAVLVLAFAAPALAQPVGPPEAQRPKHEAPVDVEGVTIVGRKLNWLLSFTVSGDVTEKTMVGSAPIGMNCGGEFYRFAKTVANRQCWLRVDHKKTVLLSAADEGRYGVDWTVEWVGCTPRANGSMCEVSLTDDAVAGAVFKRLR
jgi:hypothetical protein